MLRKLQTEGNIENQNENESDSNSIQKQPLNAVVIDYYLWNFAKQHTQLLENIPIHKTKTIFY
jgi:hypothetical protein